MPDITISLSAAAAKRLKAALTESLDPRDEAGEPRMCSLDDCKNYIVTDLKQLIKTSEKRVAILAAATGADPTIT